MVVCAGSAPGRDPVANVNQGEIVDHVEFDDLDSGHLDTHAGCKCLAKFLLVCDCAVELDLLLAGTPKDQS